MTPEQDVIARLSVPVGCGWCGEVFGIQPLPEPYAPRLAMQLWERKLGNHFYSKHHGRRKLTLSSSKGGVYE